MITTNSIGQGAFDLDIPGPQTELDLLEIDRDRSTDGAAEAQQSLDDLVTVAGVYRGSHDFRHLLSFVRRFHFYSPYNALRFSHRRG